MYRTRVISAAALLLLPLAACAPGSGSTSDRTVTAAFYPLQFVAERVAGERFVVSNLTSPGVEPHDLELGVREAAELASADLVLYESGFQPAVDAAVENATDAAVLDAAEAVELRPSSEAGEVHGEDHGEDHGENHEGEGDHPDGGALDPHFWLDPLLMADLVDAVADELEALDPEHAEEFATRAADLRRDLEALDQEYVQGLAGCERDTVVVNHDAFAYLGRYGLELEPIAGLSPDAEPTPAGLARLHRLIRTEGITTVFSETLVSKRTAQTLAGDLGITTAVLDPLEGLSSADEDYISVMRANLTALEKSNGC